MKKISSVDILENVILSSDLTMEITTVTDNLDGTFTVESCDNVSIANLCNTPNLQLSDLKWRVLEIIDDYRVKLEPIDHNEILEPGLILDFKTFNFMHGTAISANKEIQYIYEAGGDPKTIAFLISSPLSHIYYDDNSPRDRKITVRMFLLCDVYDESPIEWCPGDHGKFAINPMNRWARRIIKSINQNRYFDKVEEYKLEEVMDVGVNNQNGESIFDRPYSGVYLQFELTVYNFLQLKCCDFIKR